MLNSDYKYLSNIFIKKNNNKKDSNTIFNILDNIIDKVFTEDLIILDNEGSHNKDPISDLTSILLFLGESYEVFDDYDLYSKIVHKYMVRAKNLIEENHWSMTNSLYVGLTDFAIAIYSIVLNNKEYNKFLNTLNEEIIRRVFLQISYFKTSENGVSAADYDVINGLAGIANYLMNFRSYEEYNFVLREITEYFIDLFKDMDINSMKIPNYFIPVSKQSTEFDKEIYPNGCFNFSLSHGISGPLFILLKSKRYGILAEGLDEAIKNATHQICEYSYINDMGYYSFNGRISLEGFMSKKYDSSINRASWCYGTPGIAKVLFDSNDVTKSKDIDKIVRSSLDFILKYPEHWGLVSPTICHGYGSIAVLLQSLYMYEIDNINLLYLHDSVIEKILAMYDIKSKYGFYDIIYVDNKNKKRIKLNKNKNIDTSDLELKGEDSLTFLTGTLGIALVLLNSLEIKNRIWLQKLLMDKIG